MSKKGSVNLTAKWQLGTTTTTTTTTIIITTTTTRNW